MGYLSKYFIFFSFLIILISILKKTDILQHLFTIGQAAYYMKTSHDDYKIFPKVILKGNKLLPPLKKEIITYEKEKYNFTKKYMETLMVMKNNTIIIEEYFNKNNKDSKFNLFSATKTIISLGIGILEDRKLLNINDKVKKYLDWWLLEETTIKNVLEMSSGYGNPLINWYYDMGFDYFGYNLTSRCMSYRLNKIDKPGKYFRYSNLNSQILSEIIKKVSKMETYKFIEDNLYKYIAKNDGIWSMDRAGNIKAFCCLYLNTEDFLRFGKLVIDEGKVGDKIIISKDYLNRMWIPNSNILESKKNKLINNFYGLHTWILEYEGKKVKYFNGLQNQFNIIIDDWDLLITTFGSDPIPAERLDTEHIVKGIITDVKNILKLN